MDWQLVIYMSCTDVTSEQSTSTSEESNSEDKTKGNANGIKNNLILWVHVVFMYTGEESTNTKGEKNKKVGVYVIKWIFSIII